ncbi:MAG: leucine-rich repeat protein [Clostridia bacterium]
MENCTKSQRARMSKIFKISFLIIALVLTACMAVSCKKEEPPVPTTKSFVAQGLKDTYLVGDKLDLTGAKLAVTMSDNSEVSVDIVAEMVTGFDSAVAGAKTMFVTYDNIVKVVAYKVNPIIAEMTLTAPEIVINGNVVKWTAVQHCAQYQILLKDTSDNAITTLTTDKLELALNPPKFASYKITAIAVGNGSNIKNSVASNELVFDFDPQSITNCKIGADKVLTWDKNAYATAYVVSIGGVETTVGENKYDGAFEIDKVYLAQVKGVFGAVQGEFCAPFAFKILPAPTEFVAVDNNVDKKYALSWKGDATGSYNIMRGDKVVKAGAKGLATEITYFELKDKGDVDLTVVSAGNGYDLADSAPSNGQVAHAISTAPKATNVRAKGGMLLWSGRAIGKIGNDSISSGDKLTGDKYVGEQTIYLKGYGDGVYTYDSETVIFTFTKLSKPTNVTLENGILKWKAGNQELKYEITFSTADTKSVITVDNQYDCSAWLNGLTTAGEYTISVKAIANFKSDSTVDSDEVVTTVTKLSTPTAVTLENGILKWAASAQEVKYEIAFSTADTASVIATTNQYDCAAWLNGLTTAGTYTISVKAKAKIDSVTTIDSDEVVTTVHILDKLAFSQNGNSLEWQAVPQATGYKVKVNNGEWLDKGNVTSFDLSGFTTETTIEIKPYGADAIIARQAIATIFVVTFDPQGATMQDATKKMVVGGCAIGVLPALPEVNLMSWNSQADGKGEEINATTIISKATTVFALWTVKYGYNDVVGGVELTSLATGDTYAGDLAIPATYDGKKVVRLGDNIFKGYKNLGKVTIPNGVTSIGVRAFYGCKSLGIFTIPNSVTSIGSSAFESARLTSIKIPNSVTSIGGAAFKMCGLTSIAIPSSVTSIGDWTFYQSSISNITIPSSVVSIGEYAFSECAYLESITIPSSVTSIGNKAFNYCNALTSVIIPSSVTSLGMSAFYGCASMASVTISCASIGGSAFQDCAKLTSVTISSSVTSIGNSAFGSCSALTSVTIPSSVTSIGNGAFDYNPKLTRIEFGGTMATFRAFECFASVDLAISKIYCSDGTITQ